MYLVHCDPSICSPNIGDQIISESVENALSIILPELGQVKFPTQYSPQISTHYILRNSLANIVGGSNLLTGNRLRFSQWKFGKLNLFYKFKFILLGVGWWKYGNDPDPYSRIIYRSILDNSMIHSVRDEYTVTQLKKCGINAINTTCPTLWPLASKQLCSSIAINKSPNALLTLTDYAKNIDLDFQLIKLLTEEYKEIYFWPQGIDDLAYFKELTQSVDYDFKILSFGLPSIKQFLLTYSCDYIGTRLHSGILALNNRCRSIIIEIDNRSIEIGRDTSIYTCPRNNYLLLRKMINNPLVSNFRIPMASIKAWVNSLRSNLSLNAIHINPSSFII